MIRSGAAGPMASILRAVRPSLRASIKPHPTSPATLRPSRLALTNYKPFTTSLQRYQIADHPDNKHDKDVAKTPLERHPEEVSTTSSVHQVFHEQGVEDEGREKDEDMLAGVKHDLVSNRGYVLLSVLIDYRKRSETRSTCPKCPRKRST